MTLLQSFNNSVSTIVTLISFINIVIHFIFAGAIAKDSGQLAKIGRPTYLVSGMVWAFATLVGGILVAGLYWLIHYSTLSRGNAT